MKCSICQGVISNNEEQTTCTACNNVYHASCWVENKGCGTPGCKHLPDIKTKTDLSFADMTHWGADVKICPACGEKIKVGLFKCPLCKEDFETNTPINQREFKESKIVLPKANTPTSLKIAIVVFICGLAGCTSPFNLVIGGLWFLFYKDSIKEESGVGYVLTITGLLVSLMYIVALILALIFGLF